MQKNANCIVKITIVKKLEGSGEGRVLGAYAWLYFAIRSSPLVTSDRWPLTSWDQELELNPCNRDIELLIKSPIFPHALLDCIFF